MVEIHIGDMMSRREVNCRDYIRSNQPVNKIVDDVVNIVDDNPAINTFNVTYASYICNRNSLFGAFEDAGFGVNIHESQFSFSLTRI